VNSKSQPGFDSAVAVIFVVLGATFGVLVFVGLGALVFRAGKGFGLW
jgi:hypothetical protein